MKMVMEKSWNMKNWPTVMESVIAFCDQSWNFTNFTLNFTKFVFSLSPLNKTHRCIESLHYLTFSAKVMSLLVATGIL